MTIDIVVHAADKAALATWAETHPAGNPLRIEVGAVYDTDPESPTFGDKLQDGEMQNRSGFTYCWWAGSGKMMRTPGVYDSEGNEVTAPTFVNGVVALLRIHGDLFFEDKLDPDENDPDAAEQFARSKIVRYVKNNGTPIEVQGINGFLLDGVRMFRPQDVQAKVAEWNVSGHQWLGGNRF